jgi:ribonuclease T1
MKFLRDIALSVLLLGSVTLLTGCGKTVADQALSQKSSSGAVAQAVLGEPAADTQNNSSNVAISRLTPEARQTIQAIKNGGPFRYHQDGTIFNNREGRLPYKPRGYYREYTVPTPGARDRGARRIIAGSGGELYYTEDHYNTFRLIKE